MTRGIMIAALLCACHEEAAQAPAPVVDVFYDLSRIETRINRLSRRAVAAARIREANLALASAMSKQEQREARLAWVLAQAELHAAFTEEPTP